MEAIDIFKSWKKAPLLHLCVCVCVCWGPEGPPLAIITWPLGLCVCVHGGGGGMGVCLYVCVKDKTPEGWAKHSWVKINIADGVSLSMIKYYRF